MSLQTPLILPATSHDVTNLYLIPLCKPPGTYIDGIHGNTESPSCLSLIDRSKEVMNSTNALKTTQVTLIFIAVFM